MKKNKDPYKSHCPINFAQETFGDRWSLLIIRDLMFKNKKYYGDLLKSDEKISTNILANRLEKLEHQGLISKTMDPDNHVKYIYTLTPKGEDLMPMLIEMIQWSAKYDDKTEAPDEFIHRLEEDKLGLINTLKAELKQS